MCLGFSLLPLSLFPTLPPPPSLFSFSLPHFLLSSPLSPLLPPYSPSRFPALPPSPPYSPSLFPALPLLSPYSSSLFPTLPPSPSLLPISLPRSPPLLPPCHPFSLPHSPLLPPYSPFSLPHSSPFSILTPPSLSTPRLSLSHSLCFCMGRKPSVANVAVRRQFQRLLEFIRDGRLHVVSSRGGELMARRRGREEGGWEWE